MNYVVRSSRRS